MNGSKYLYNHLRHSSYESANILVVFVANRAAMRKIHSNATASGSDKQASTDTPQKTCVEEDASASAEASRIESDLMSSNRTKRLTTAPSQ